MWASAIASFNAMRARPCSAIQHIFAYGGSIEYYAALDPPRRTYLPTPNLEAAAAYARTTGVEAVTLVIDGHTGGADGDGGIRLRERSAAQLGAWAAELAGRVCSMSYVDGLQLDLEPLDAPSLPAFTTFVSQLSARLRAPPCTDDAHPAGRSLGAFGSARHANWRMWRALGPNGYYVVSGYDLPMRAEDGSWTAPNTPESYARALEAEVETIVREAGKAEGKFVLGLPAAATRFEFERRVRADGVDEAGGATSQVAFVRAALAVVAAKGLDANPAYLGAALWGFAPTIEIPRGSGERYFPSNAFEAPPMRDLIADAPELCMA